LQDLEFSYKNSKFRAFDSGQGIAVVFLHGFLENRKMWSPLVEALPKKYRCIALDLPGHGDSENLAYVHSMEEMAEVVKALLDHLKIRRAVVIGHSMGGYVALALSDRYPDLLKGMVLMNSTARADNALRKYNRDRAIALVKRNAKSYVRNSIPMLFRPLNRKKFSEEVKEIKGQALETSAQGIVAALEGMKNRIDREVILNFAPYPILFVASKKDPVLGWEQLEEQFFHEAVEPLVLSEGHMSHVENFPELFGGIKQFLAKA
jgi:pimeloyl-ACP methyl ester carboxylesterase